jgi:hypothetical protein
MRDQASGKTGVEAGIYSRMKSEANRMDELKPVNVDLLRSDIAALRNEIRDLRELLATRSTAVESGYLDAKAAAAYCGLSRGTFDKYRYQTRVKVHGFKLDGKVLYRREDLDEFIKLYEIRSKGT